MIVRPPGLPMAQLTEIAVPLHGVTRTYHALRRHLPDDLWITRIQVERREPTWHPQVGGAGAQRTSRKAQIPVVVYNGKGVAVSGGDLGATYRGFAMMMTADPDIPKLITQADSGLLTFTGTVDYLFPEALVPETGDDGGGK